jgi:hypothetical protein
MVGLVAPSAGQLKAFRDLFRSSSSAHSQEVLRALADPQTVWAKLDVHEIPAGCGLQSTYRRRAEHLTAKERDGTLCLPRDNGDVAPPTLAADMRQLSAGLDAARDQPVQVWIVSLLDRTEYLIFVLMEDRRIAGVVKTSAGRGTQ